jgi:hypothetical protein
LHGCEAYALPFSDRLQHRTQLLAHTSKPGRNWFNTFPSKGKGKMAKVSKICCSVLSSIGDFHW